MIFSYFSAELSQDALIFEGLALLLLVGVLFYGIRHYKFFLWRFFALAFGVFCFEGLTGAMWDISHLGKYAYIHNDISWIMTLTWSSIIFTTRFMYDTFIQNKSLKKEFSYVILGGSLLSGLLLIVLKNIGIFGYSKTIQDALSNGVFILGRPLEFLIYMPTFIFTAYSFYKYWELAMYAKGLFSNYRLNPGKDIIIASGVIILVGYLIHPLLEMTTTGVIFSIVGYILGLIVVNYMINSIKDIPLFQRNMGGVFLLSLYGMGLISWMIGLGMMHVSQSIKDTYTVNTVQIPGLNITDVEFVGIVLFSCLLIAIVKYFKVIVSTDTMTDLNDNKMTFRGLSSLLIK